MNAMPQNILGWLKTIRLKTSRGEVSNLTQNYCLKMKCFNKVIWNTQFTMFLAYKVSFNSLQTKLYELADLNTVTSGLINVKYHVFSFFEQR